jgi:hypothetical protein
MLPLQLSIHVVIYFEVTDLAGKYMNMHMWYGLTCDWRNMMKIMTGRSTGHVFVLLSITCCGAILHCNV